MSRQIPNRYLAFFSGSLPIMLLVSDYWSHGLRTVLSP